MKNKVKRKSRNLDVYAVHGSMSGDGKHHVYYGDFSLRVELKPEKFPRTKRGWDEALEYAERKGVQLGLNKISINAPDYKGRMSLKGSPYRKAIIKGRKSPRITPKRPKLRR